MYSKSNSTLLTILLVLLISQNIFASANQTESDKPTSEDLTIIVRENEDFTAKVIDLFPLNSAHTPLISVKIHQLSTKGTLTANFYDYTLNTRVYSAISSNDVLQRDESIRYNSGAYDGTSSVVNYDNFTFSVIDGREVETESVYTVQINLLRANGIYVQDFSKNGTKNNPIPFTATDFTSKYTNFNTSETIQKVVVKTLPPNGVLQFQGVNVRIGDEITFSTITDFTFVPDRFWHGTTTFDYNVIDQSGDVAINDATITINIEEQRHIPVAVDDNATTTSNTPLIIAAKINDYDDDNDPIEILSIDNVVNGTATIENQEVRFVPTSGFIGNATITYTLTDNTDGTDQAVINIVVTNDLPIVTDINYNGVIGDTIWLAKTDFINNFADAHPLEKIQIKSLPSIGILKNRNTAVNVNDEVIVADIDELYLVATRDLNVFFTSFEWNGWDGMSYAIDNANVIITITNDLPIVEDIFYSGRVGDTIWLDKNDFIHEFTDSDVLQKIQVRSLPLIGELFKSENKIAVNDEIDVNDINDIYFIAYSNINKVGTSFLWNGWDGLNYAIDNANVNITLGLPFPPIVSDFEKYGSLNSDILFELQDYEDNFKDFSGFRLDSIQLTSLPNYGTFYLDGVAIVINQTIGRNHIRDLVYTPNNDYFGFDNVDYTAFNGFNWAVNSAVIKIVIDGVSADPPVIDDIYKEGPQNTDIPITLSDFLEVYSDDVIQEIYISTLPENGNLYHNDILVEENDFFTEISFSEFIYEPNLNYAGKDSISWNASNGQVYASQDALVHIKIKPELVIYSSFSPNGDNYNDYWHIKDIEFYPNNTVTIYNRWGNVVYNDEKYDNTTVRWEGINHDNGVVGKYLTAGTYFYKIDLRDGTSIRSGFVVIAK
ncbi:T9SS type B sorting domain-containing protein [Flammeovirga kamogawensis]|uniref:Gliding motility-associated C-terminal domain-containing protein n=1 Tax=Flammeovirga kamogawensis TaxID=373891 RepID=A0ABX8H382_9BACT|nr:gliding motility-associated C-terminal domain-containing protein [Flammeovirga kamogawensis]MBB6460309.1 gliding motility-associated-like protein [Flammeovirga kamogawensis]QWG10118.1 gliding motility-associated C-terminal domain-containing protein [Flammeovirga kamogawensis]TRX65626.1 T9SS type B sorting domain-containing protein [Flammeovirga kamogawensis]